MKTKDILRALEICSQNKGCSLCPMEANSKENCECLTILAGRAAQVIKEQAEKNERLRAVIGVLEADIAERDERLERNLAEVYPEFMRDYDVMRKELEEIYDKGDADLAVLERAIERYGSDMQLNVAIEELSELIKEICKAKRGTDNRPAIIEEMADCFVMLDQLSLIFQINRMEIDSVIDSKIQRLKERMEGK